MGGAGQLFVTLYDTVAVKEDQNELWWGDWNVVIMAIIGSQLWGQLLPSY